MARKKKKRMSREERLAKLREKLANTDIGGGGGGFWSPKEGRNVIRILPEVGEMDFFFQEVGRHNFPDSDDRVYCPRFTSGGELDCPICEMVWELYDAGDNASKELAKQIRVRKSYWVNIINRDDETAGPQIFTPGVMIFSELTSLINDPDYGDIFNIEDGFDITIEREGTGRYDTVYYTRARPRPSPLSDDDAQIDQWLDAAKDLSYVEVSMDPEEDKDLAGDHAVYVLPYDRIVDDHDLDGLMDILDEEDYEEEYEEDDYEDEDEEEEDEVEQEVRRRARRRRGSRRRRR